MLLGKHRGPLASDFRRYYSLSLAGIRATGIPLHEVADLAANLPPGSAVARATNPEWWYTPEVSLLHSIEYHLRVGLWRQTPDANAGSTSRSRSTSRATESRTSRRTVPT